MKIIIMVHVKHLRYLRLTPKTLECAEIQLSDSGAESDTTMDCYSPFTFVNEMVSKNASQVHDVSASSTDVLQKFQNPFKWFKLI